LPLVVTISSFSRPGTHARRTSRKGQDAARGSLSRPASRLVPASARPTLPRENLATATETTSGSRPTSYRRTTEQSSQPAIRCLSRATPPGHGRPAAPAGPARDAPLYRPLRRRAPVEREFGRLKYEWALSALRDRGAERVRLHADLTILVKLARHLARARALPSPRSGSLSNANRPPHEGQGPLSAAIIPGPSFVTCERPHRSQTIMSIDA